MAGDIKVAAFNPAEGRRIWDATKYVESMRGQRVDADSPPQSNHSSPVYFKNVSGVVIPAWGCIQPVGITMQSDVPYINAARPIDYTKGPSTFLFNYGTEIPVDGFGFAQQGTVFRTISDGSTLEVGTRVGPKVSTFTLNKGCLFTYLGPDPILTNGIRVVRCDTPLLATAGSLGIAGNSSGTVTHRIPAAGNWSAGTVTYTAWAPTSTPITANAIVLLFPVDTKWVAVEIC